MTPMQSSDETHSQAGTEATPEPEGPPQRPTQRIDIWEDDGSLSSLPPMPSPLDYSVSTRTPLDGEGLFVMDDNSSLFSDKSFENRLHRTLNQAIYTSNHGVKTQAKRSSPAALEPTLEVARLVQQVEILRETNQELRHENKLLVTGAKALEAQREGLVEAKMTAELREREARQEVTLLKQQVEQAHGGMEKKDQEIQQLRTQLDQVSLEREKEQAEQRSALDQAMKDANSDISNLRTQNASLEQEKKDLAKVLEETQALLEKATDECKARKGSMDIGTQTESLVAGAINNEETAREPIVSDVKPSDVDDLELVSNTVNQNTSPQEHSPAESLPIGERLVRIRDAAERASLVKEHQREISRLVAKHEAETKLLLEKFEKEKDSLLEEAMAEMNAGYKGLRQRLEAEHDKKMEKVERHFQSELERVRQEAAIATTSANESVDEAMAQLASANQRCRRETKRREAIELRLDQLQKDFDAQQKALTNKFTTDISKLGHGWEEERRNLVDTLQRECNSVFDRTKSSSPHSVTTEFFTDINVAEKQHMISPVGERPTMKVRSPTFTELERTLHETEALVEKVLNSKVDA